jgi:hypothetical protein
MRKKVFFLLVFACLFIVASAEDTTKVKKPKFVLFQMAEGFVLPTSKIVKGETEMPHVAALSFKYGLSARGNKWEDYYYGMPYRGVGIYKPFYSMRREMGSPFSVYLFQGARLKEFSSGLSLHYEINLGMSFNWNKFDALTNAGFEVLGSSVNAHLAGNCYFKKKLSGNLNLHFGMGITHFSNGAQRTPNYGINTLSPVIELVYDFNKETSRFPVDGSKLPAPLFEKRVVHDLSFFVTGRTVSVDAIEGNLRSKYPEQRFKVAGFGYSYMLHNLRRFMWGPSVEIIYDEGSNVTVYGNVLEETGRYIEIVKLGKMSERFSLGLSVKGELAMPGYSIFANLGYDILCRRKGYNRLYQIYGVKVYFTRGLFSSVAVNSTHITRSKFLYINIGYTFYKDRRNKAAPDVF